MTYASYDNPVWLQKGQYSPPTNPSSSLALHVVMTCKLHPLLSNIAPRNVHDICESSLRIVRHFFGTLFRPAIVILGLRRSCVCFPASAAKNDQDFSSCVLGRIFLFAPRPPQCRKLYDGHGQPRGCPARHPHTHDLK